MSLCVRAAGLVNAARRRKAACKAALKAVVSPQDTQKNRLKSDTPWGILRGYIWGIFGEYLDKYPLDDKN